MNGWMNEYPTCRYARNSSSISLSSPLKLGFVATCFPGWGSRKQDISEKQEVRLLLNRIIFMNSRPGCFRIDQLIINRKIEIAPEQGNIYEHELRFLMNR